LTVTSGIVHVHYRERLLGRFNSAGSIFTINLPAMMRPDRVSTRQPLLQAAGSPPATAISQMPD
jgi:hypothetical protein